MGNILATSRPWNEGMAKRLTEKNDGEVVLINSPEELTLDKIRKINPRYIFFPHWSTIIPSEIYENYECVVFHMTDLPFGRGGSPLQNLIERGIYETKISALRCQAVIDGGPIYLKMPLSLHGSAEEIFLRASKVVERMIQHIIDNEPVPEEQSAGGCSFPRRKAAQGDIAKLEDLERIFDYIRMLDAEGYPHAFLETDFLRLEFSRASLKQDCILADVKIMMKKEQGHD